MYFWRQIDYVDTLRECQDDFIKVPLSKAAADVGVDAWVINFKVKTLGQNFAILNNLCVRNDSSDFIVFDILYWMTEKAQFDSLYR